MLFSGKHRRISKFCMPFREELYFIYSYWLKEILDKVLLLFYKPFPCLCSFIWLDIILFCMKPKTFLWRVYIVGNFILMYKNFIANMYQVGYHCIIRNFM